MEFVLKSWGYENIYVNNELYCFKELMLSPGKFTSIHQHVIKDETLMVHMGMLFYEVYEMDDSNALRLVSGACITHGGMVRVLAGTIHRLVNMSTSEHLLIREVSTHHDDRDTTRYSEDLVLLPPPPKMSVKVL
jgi:D-lyxose ketol-isomerase